MEKSFSKSLFMYVASLFFAVLAISIILNLNKPSWYNNIKAEVTSQPYARTITVSAEGKITAKPDIALIDLSVVSNGKTVKEVTKDGNVKMTQVIDAVKKLGVKSEDITSSQYNLYPQYVYYDKQTPKIQGYSLTQEIRVKVRNLENADDVLEAGISAGSNQIGQLTFDIDDPAGIKKQAREKAFETAKQKAQEMASAAGVKLGRVVTFSEDSSNYYQPVYANYSMKAMDSAESVPAPSIEPGSKDVSLNVSVTYEIE